MVFDDDMEPKKKSEKVYRVLDDLSVDELRDYIAEMKEEIARVEGEIEKKTGHRSAADALFRTPD